MRNWLLALFALLALLVGDLVLLVYLGTVVGFWPALGLALASAVLGAWLAKREGLRVLDDARRALGEGRLPEDGITGGLLVLGGGLLLASPGVLTDVAGLLLLLPPTRRWLAARIRARLERSLAGRGAAIPGAGPFGAAGVGTGPGFFAWSWSSGPAAGPWSAPRGGRRYEPRGEIIDAEAEEVVVEEVVPPSRRLSG